MNAPGGEQLLGIAAIISSVMGPAVVIWRTNRLDRKVDEVKREVVTGNEQTLGQLGMRSETHRVEDIPHDERTAQEQRHVDADPLSKQEQGVSHVESDSRRGSGD